MDWDDDKQKQLMDFMAPQGMNPATQTMGIGAPPAGGSPPPPTVSPQEKPLTSMVDDDEGGYDKQEEDGGEKIVDSHPLAQLPGYIQNQEQQVDKWGPDKQAALMQHLQEGYKSPGNIIAKGGASLADAIMQGVARAGSGGNLAAINERENQNLNRAQDMGKSLQTQNLEALQKKQGLEQMSSSTPLGESEALATKMLAKQLFPNLSPEKLDQLTQNPTALAKYFPSEMEYKKAIAEIQGTAEFRKESIENQRATLANTASNERAGHVQGAANTLEHRGFLEKVRDAISPSPETKAMENVVATGGGGQSAPNIDHNAALKWAQSNPKDPRAKIIMQKAREGLSGR